MQLLKHSLAGILDELRTGLQAYPRRQPGWLEVAGVPLHFADLHSFYYQGRQIFFDGFYDFETDSPGPVIVDCGAHIGMSALFFAKRYPGASIRAFEADPAIADLLAKNVRAFGLDSVEARQAAVWTHDGGVSFDVCGDDSGTVHEGAAARVPSVRLRDILAERPVDMLKMDIEGAEFEVLEDCADVLGQVDKAILEAHCLGPNQGPGRILGLLEAAGFTCRIGDLESMTWAEDKQPTPFPHLKEKRQLFNIYAWRE